MLLVLLFCNTDCNSNLTNSAIIRDIFSSFNDFMLEMIDSLVVGDGGGGGGGEGGGGGGGGGRGWWGCWGGGGGGGSGGGGCSGGGRGWWRW